MSEDSVTTVPPFLHKLYTHEAIAREPWADDTVLYVPQKSLYLTENGAAESMAAAAYLETLGLKFQIKAVTNVSDMSPSGKSPMLKCGRFSISEYEPIVNFCNLKGYRLLSDYANNSSRDQIKPYLLLIRKTYADIIDYTCWKHEAGRKLIKNGYCANYSFPLNYLLYFKEYKFNQNRLVATKVWNLDQSELLDKFVEINEAINRKLEGKVYLINNGLSEVDILLYSFIRVLKSNGELFEEAVRRLDQFPNILDFYANLNLKFDRMLSTEFEN